MKLMKKKKEKIFLMPTCLRKGSGIFIFIMCLPAIYGIIKYVLINGYSILLGFSDGDPFTDGFSLRNFKMFFNDFKGNGILLIALKNTIKYYLVGVVQQFLCYIVAYYLYKEIPGHKLFRFAMYLPCLIPGVVSAAIFMEIIRVGGPLYRIVDTLFGIQYQDLLSHPETATKTMIIYILCNGIGTTYLIYVGAMKRIPMSVLESAELDGCNSWKEFWHIVFPLTFGTYATFFLMSLCGMFTASGPILYMTQGAANTTTLGYWLFSQVIDGYSNYPAAVGVIFTLIGIPILIIVRKVLNKLTPEVSY